MPSRLFGELSRTGAVVVEFGAEVLFGTTIFVTLSVTIASSVDVKLNVECADGSVGGSSLATASSAEEGPETGADTASVAALEAVAGPVCVVDGSVGSIFVGGIDDFVPPVLGSVGSVDMEDTTSADLGGAVPSVDSSAVS